MAFEKRTRSKLATPGPFLAEVTNHLDPTYMGGLEVSLIKGMANNIANQSETYAVKYLSPFYGVTSVRFEGNNPADFNSVQKSYGMWMIPPDIGTTVIVIFIDGDPNQGYWFGCVQDAFQNHMVPGIAASLQTEITPEQQRQYGTTYLPVAEYLKKTQKLENLNVDKIKKPIHPFADRLVAQGLLLDTIRGVTSSSARREVPSAVFGISTPGPVDVNAPQRGKVGYEGNRQIPVSRLGGSSFVMDDGDVNGQNELVRIRTRTGHQILLHNSSDLIYIANSKGTAWLEMTSNGKIDIYARDSISIHSEQDFNFRADRDINLESGRNINVYAQSGIEINSIDRFYLLCNKNGKLEFGGDANLTSGKDIKFTSGADTHLNVGGSIFQSAAKDINIDAGGQLYLNSIGNLSLGTNGSVLASGTQIHLNGPAAGTATPAVSADLPTPLTTFTLPNRNPSTGWANSNFYKTSDITSIMMRVPTHEPWDQHENINPYLFTSAATDVQVTPPAAGDGPSNPTAPDGSGSPPVNTNPLAKPSSANTSSWELYLQSALVNNGVTDPTKLAAWMAQAKIESANFTTLKEYASGAEYEGRKDLGNTQPGDGVKFKGRGFIQLTGRDAYQKFTNYVNQPGIDFVKNPELLETPEWGAASVPYFFDEYKKGFKNRYMQLPATDPNFNWSDSTQVTGLVNGGQNALAQRTSAYNDYLAKFQANGVQPQGPAGTPTAGVVPSS